MQTIKRELFMTERAGLESAVGELNLSESSLYWMLRTSACVFINGRDNVVIRFNSEQHKKNFEHALPMAQIFFCHYLKRIVSVEVEIKGEKEILECASPIIKKKIDDLQNKLRLANEKCIKYASQIAELQESITRRD